MIRTDILGAPYTAETIKLGDADDGPVVTTLVHRPADSLIGRRKAVLYVHGFNDYFFNTEYAEWWTGRGYDFYAVDLRRYGRSLLSHQTPCYTTNLREYFDDLDAVWGRLTHRDGHTEVVATAHSTGGLVMSLYADEQPEGLAALILNAPWVDMHASVLMRTAGDAVVRRVGARRAIPRPVTSVYGRSLHKDHAGEWDYRLDWKALDSWPIYAGWLNAIRVGHAELQAGLDVNVPVLVLSSASSLLPMSMTDEVHHHDIVLDVEQIRRWSTQIGHHVTYAAVPGARHDIFLSLAGPRKQSYAEVNRWLGAYGP